MTELKGDQNLKEVIVAGAKVFNAISEAKKNDGKIDLKDLPLVIGIVPALIAAVDGLGEVVPEFKDLSAEEIADISAALIAELGGVDADVKVKIEKSLIAVSAIYQAVKAFA